MPVLALQVPNIVQQAAQALLLLLLLLLLQTAAHSCTHD